MAKNVAGGDDVRVAELVAAEQGTPQDPVVRVGQRFVSVSEVLEPGQAEHNGQKQAAVGELGSGEIGVGRDRRRSRAGPRVPHAQPGESRSRLGVADPPDGGLGGAGRRGVVNEHVDLERAVQPQVPLGLQDDVQPAQGGVQREVGAEGDGISDDGDVEPVRDDGYLAHVPLEVGARS